MDKFDERKMSSAKEFSIPGMSSEESASGEPMSWFDSMRPSAWAYCEDFAALFDHCKADWLSKNFHKVGKGSEGVAKCDLVSNAVLAAT